MMAALGSTDKRLDRYGQQHGRLTRLWKGYAKGDGPPDRVKPVPLTVLNEVYRQATSGFDYAVADMCYIGFFFLNRPGEHTAANAKDSLSAPFRLCDVILRCGGHEHCGPTVPMESLGTAWSASLVYTNQKNTVRGQSISHGTSGHSIACPVQALTRRIQHLRTHAAPATTPLYRFYNPGGTFRDIQPADVTTALRRAAATLLPILGIDPASISARSLRPGGATAMLCARIDRDITRLLGRWQSDEMLKYLHAQAAPAMRTYANQMVANGHFTYKPTDDTTQPGTFLPGSPGPMGGHTPIPGHASLGARGQGSSKLPPAQNQTPYS